MKSLNRFYIYIMYNELKIFQIKLGQHYLLILCYKLWKVGIDSKENYLCI